MPRLGLLFLRYRRISTLMVTLLVVSSAAVFALHSDQPAIGFCARPGLTDAQIAAHRGIAVELIQQLRVARSLSPAAICVMPQSKLDRAIFRVSNPKPDKPDEAIAWRNLALKDERGVIKLDGFELAHDHVARMRANTPEPNAPAAGINRGQWRSLGPGNIGGRVRVVLVHPSEPNRMWAGSVSGGIWYTSNGGAEWDPVDDFMGNLAVSTMVMDPTNPNVMYAGTGEGFYNGDGIQGAGIFKSTDGGVSWSQLGSTANTNNFLYVNRLSLANNGAILLAATNSGLWRSTNGGVSWNQMLLDSVLDVDFKGNSATYAVASGRNGEVWYSTNGGSNWSISAGLPPAGRVEVAYAPSVTSGGGTVYASVNTNSGEIWKSTNGGQSFNRMSTGYNYLGSQGWYDNIIWVAPNDPNLVIVGGLDLWISSNGGATLKQISTWWKAPESAHADNHAIVAHPAYNGTTNRTVFFGNDGGVYKAADINILGNNPPENTVGWQELNNNLGITQFYGAAGNPTTGVIVGGTQDNGTLIYNGDSENWTTTFGGDGGFSAADPTDPGYFYGEYVNARIHRSNNAGGGSEYIYGENKNPPYAIGDVSNNQANFIAPFILDPNNPNRMLVGAYRLWRSNDVKAPNTSSTGPQWASIKAGSGDNISAIAVAQGNSDIIWVGHNNGDVYRTSNGTAASPAWTRVDTGSPALPNRYVTRIAIDPNIHSIAYVTFGGFSSNNVYRTTDNGTTWADRTGTGATGLPDAPVRSLAISPVNSNWLYAGTEVGIFASENAGISWKLPHDGPSNVSVDELFWVGDSLTAATHGRGIYQVVASLRLSATSLNFGEQQVGIASVAEPVTIVNTSNSSIFNISIPISGDFTRTTTCGASLAPGASCTVSISFNPTTIGNHDGTLTITSSATGSPHTVSLAGIGITTTTAGPAVPSNLQVAAVSASSVSLAWQDDSTNELGFRIYKWGVVNGVLNFHPLTTVGANITSFTESGLACGVNDYFYLITAYNSAGESAQTPFVKATTITCPTATSTPTPAPPISPNNLQVAGVSASSVSLSWRDNSANELGFRIYKWAFVNGVLNFHPLTTVGANITSFTESGLTCGVSDYFYLITAYNNAGESAQTPWKKATTLTCSTTTATATRTNTATPTATRSSTATPTATHTNTATPSATATATSTNTPVVATATSTSTPLVAATATATATSTNTPVVATATATSTPLVAATATTTDTSTNTPVVATTTATSTPLVAATATTTDTSTNTPVVATATATSTPVVATPAPAPSNGRILLPVVVRGSRP